MKWLYLPKIVQNCFELQKRLCSECMQIITTHTICLKKTADDTYEGGSI